MASKWLEEVSTREANSVSDLLEKPSALIKRKINGAVTTFVGGVAACLIGKQVDLRVVRICPLQQINDIAMVSHRYGGLSGRGLAGQSERFFGAGGRDIDPTLAQSRLDPARSTSAMMLAARGFFENTISPRRSACVEMTLAFNASWLEAAGRLMVVGRTFRPPSIFHFSRLASSAAF